jgi:Leucine-rich repeat (LRR) protein
MFIFIESRMLLELQVEAGTPSNSSLEFRAALRSFPSHLGLWISSLTELRLEHCALKDVSAICDLAGLISVNLDDNELDRFPDLFHMRSLEKLSLRRNRITNVSGLVVAVSLRSLNIDGNPHQPSHDELQNLCPFLSKIDGASVAAEAQKGVSKVLPFFAIWSFSYGSTVDVESH